MLWLTPQLPLFPLRCSPEVTFLDLFLVAAKGKYSAGFVVKEEKALKLLLGCLFGRSLNRK